MDEKFNACLGDIFPISKIEIEGNLILFEKHCPGHVRKNSSKVMRIMNVVEKVRSELTEGRIS